MTTDRAVTPSPTETDPDAPTTLCLLLGSSFFGQCQHVRCASIHSALIEAQAIVAARQVCDDSACGCRREVS